MMQLSKALSHKQNQRSSPFVHHPLSRNIASHTITRASVTKATHVNMHNIAPIDTLGFNAQNRSRDPSTHQNLSPMITKNQLPLHAKSKYTIVSPIDANQLSAYLQGYDPTLSKFLVEGFKFGFKIPFQGTRQFRFSENLSSLKGNEFVLWQTINKE